MRSTHFKVNSVPEGYLGSEAKSDDCKEWSGIINVQGALSGLVKIVFIYPKTVISSSKEK